MKNRYTIGETSEAFSIPASTLRFYESEQLLDPVPRDQNGRRYYTAKEFRRIRFILTLREAGVSVEEIKRYVYLFHQGVSTIPERKKILTDRLSALKEETEHLNRIISQLEDMIENYEDTFMKRELESRKNDPHYG